MHTVAKRSIALAVILMLMTGAALTAAEPVDARTRIRSHENGLCDHRNDGESPKANRRISSFVAATLADQGAVGL